jgi:murein DD-endopeptidase MepM/ murein hydrolase activator NlpD
MNPKLIVAPVAGVCLMAIGGAHTAPTDVSLSRGTAPGQMAWPLRSEWVVTQPYGCTPFLLEPAARWCPTGHFHSGIDMAAPAGTVVHAAAPGVVHVAGSRYGYGLFVVVDHGGGIATLYGHLEWTALRDGDPIDGGGELGRVGSTGLSTGPHLHFEVRRDGRPVDPNPWLPAGR